MIATNHLLKMNAQPDRVNGALRAGESGM